MQIQSLYDVYRALPDSRTATGKRFNQAGVLALITLALIAQQNSLRQISAWLAACDPALGARLGFRFGRLPSYGTIRRVLLQLDLMTFTFPHSRAGRTPSRARCPSRTRQPRRCWRWLVMARRSAAVPMAQIRLPRASSARLPTI